MCQSKRFKPEEEAAPLKTTAEEVAKGFLEGPYSEQEISVLLETEDWSLSPRFVLFQGTGGKIRVIDDAKKSAVNAAYSSTVKLQLQDVDYAANMVLFLMSEAAAAGVSGDEWMGKTFDLSQGLQTTCHSSCSPTTCGGRISCEWHLEILSKYLPALWLHWKRVRLPEGVSSHMVHSD